MSLFRSMNVSCPKCGETVHLDAVASVNADRRPDLRDAILRDAFQDTTCGACGTAVRLPPEFTFLDVGRGQWLAVFPADRVPDHLALEDEAQALFDGFYGPTAPEAAQDVGRGLTPRLVFGWPAVREKILARELGLDDVVLEELKLDVLRRVPEAPLSPGVELRLVAGSAEMLSFAWIEADTEEVRTSLDVKRALYDGVAGDPEGWADLRAALTEGIFVDMQKLYLGEGRA